MQAKRFFIGIECLDALPAARQQKADAHAPGVNGLNRGSVGGSVAVSSLPG
jgi:hypothetical protein